MWQSATALSSISATPTSVSTSKQQGVVEIIGHSTCSAVAVANHQTLVVGHLINNKTYKKHNTVPGIGKPPLIGGLFNQTQSHRSET